MIKTLILTLCLLPLVCLSQLDSMEYNQFLKEIMKVKSVQEIFPSDSIFSNEKFVSYIRNKYKNGKVIYDTNSGCYQLLDSADWVLFFGIKTSHLFSENYFELNFYDEFGHAKGPDWWFFGNGNIKIKRFWDQTIHGDNSNIIKVRQYSETRFFKSNGKIKRTGQFEDDKKIGLWIFYKKNGTVKRQKNYG